MHLPLKYYSYRAEVFQLYKPNTQEYSALKTMEEDMPKGSYQFDERVTWNEHILTVVNKAKQATFFTFTSVYLV